MEIFRNIIDCRSMTAIGYMAEDALAANTDVAMREALQGILNTNKLDEAYAIAHEQLGETEKAAELRAWLSRPRAQLDAETLELLQL
jgi:hypothetical protein